MTAPHARAKLAACPPRPAPRCSPSTAAASPPGCRRGWPASAGVIVEAIAHEYGRTEVLRRLSNPFWFQSFGAVMGMDWHSSGITTSVIGALKRGLAPVERELGIHVCGGRGRHSRRTPDELTALGERVGVDAPALVRASRLVAKVDSAAVQDGFELYLHGFIVDRRRRVGRRPAGDERRAAAGAAVPLDLGPRRHGGRRGGGAFVEEPHAAIEGRPAAGRS